MADGDGRNEENSADDQPRLQFSIRGLFIVTTAVALLFGILRGLGIPPETMILILDHRRRGRGSR